MEFRKMLIITLYAEQNIIFKTPNIQWKTYSFFFKWATGISNNLEESKKRLNKKVKYLYEVVEWTRLAYSNKNLNSEYKIKEEKYRKSEEMDIFSILFGWC